MTTTGKLLLWIPEAWEVTGYSGAFLYEQIASGGLKVIRVGRTIRICTAARGWHEFPFHSPVGESCSCGKPDCEDAAKHPRTAHGLLDATTDEPTSRQWWTT